MDRELWWHRCVCLFAPFVAVGFLICGGCGGGGGSSPSRDPTITSFTAARNPITAGTSTTLTAVFNGGTGVVSDGIGVVTSGVPVSTGNLTTSTTFILTVTNGAGRAVSTTVTVNVAAAPRITSFSATPATLAPGGSATLNAVFENGVGTVDQGVGSITSGTGVRTSALTATTTFTLVVANQVGDRVQASTTVIVSRFSATGSMGTLRTHHTATLLPNGKVLIVGGFDNTSWLASAELYDPSTGTFASTGSMNLAPQQGHTATLLPSGRVLVVGATSPPDWQIVCELYDPSTGVFSTTGPTGKPRNGHSATLLRTGKVLITGGVHTDGAAMAELYDPASGQFTYTGSMVFRTTYAEGYRFGHTATLLQDGKVLIAGGRNSSAELYE